MARLFLIALGFVLAGLCESVVRVGREWGVDWLFRTVLAGTYLIATVVLLARLLFCWGGCAV